MNYGPIKEKKTNENRSCKFYYDTVWENTFIIGQNAFFSDPDRRLSPPISPNFGVLQIPLIFILSQQLLQFNWLQFKPTYKSGSITAALLLLTSLFYYHLVAYKQSACGFLIYEQLK